MRPAPRQNRMGMALPILILSIAVSATGEAPKIYKWVDSNGIAHYTTDPERIPKPLRNRIQSIDRGASETTPAPSEPVATTPVAPVAPTPTVTTPEEIASPVLSEPVADPRPPAPTAPSAPAIAETVPAPIPSPVADPEPAAEPMALAPAPMPDPEPIAETLAEPAVQPVFRTPTASTQPRDEWLERDAVPRLESLAFLTTGEATPAQLEALAAEQRALDSRIADVEGEIRIDETFLKGLISDPDLSADVPLFDQPAFLEVSKRLPELHAQLQELRDERAKLELP